MPPQNAAAARCELAAGLAAEDRGDDALACGHFRAATQLDAGCAVAWRHFGNQLRRMGQFGAAGECFERAMAAGDDRPLNGFYLSAVGVGSVMPSAPAPFVQALFDQYASRFEEHLVHQLDYRVPDRLAELLAPGLATGFDAVLDLGCGTGLVGRPFRSRARLLTGVDLSQQMLEQARAADLYDRLVQDDLAAHLRSTRATHDLVLCADVFIYIGDLDAVFAGVSRVLRPGGSFAFSVETGQASGGFDLLPSLRYVHSERYLRSLAAAYGLDVIRVEQTVLRKEREQPVAGSIWHLRCPPGSGA